MLAGDLAESRVDGGGWWRLRCVQHLQKELSLIEVVSVVEGVLDLGLGGENEGENGRGDCCRREHQKEETEEGNEEAEWPRGHGRISGCPSAELLQAASDLDCRLGATDSVGWCSPGVVLGWVGLGSWASPLSEVSDVQWQRKVSSTPPVFSSSTPAATATAQICHFLSSGSCGGTRPRLYMWWRIGHVGSIMTVA